jgi:hypothetical protein
MREHGSPEDRGSADAYYGRLPQPHKYPNGTGNSPRIELTDPVEIAAYLAAYEGETDRKDWGE